jgi:nucleoside-diphosphate-sugar epimerase
MRVLVTGASGTLGAYVLPALVEAGHDPIAWGGRDAGPRAGISLRPIDLADPSVTDEALEADDPDAILHLAAVSTPAAVLGDPDRAHLVNVEAHGAARRMVRAIGASPRLHLHGPRLQRPDPPEPRGRPDRPAVPLRADQARRGTRRPGDR